MKNISLVLNIVLFVGLGALYFFHFSANCKKGEDLASTENINTELGIAYVNVDSVIIDYTYAQELTDAITKKQSNMKARLEKEGKEFEKEAQVFQDKVQRGIFLTQQRAEEAQQQLVMRQQELQKLEYDYQNQLSFEQQNMQRQLFDSIKNYINEYNTPEQFQIILGHSLGGSMLYGATEIDITKNISAGLNNRYAPAE